MNEERTRCFALQLSALFFMRHNRFEFDTCSNILLKNLWPSEDNTNQYVEFMIILNQFCQIH